MLGNTGCAPPTAIPTPLFRPPQRKSEQQHTHTRKQLNPLVSCDARRPRKEQTETRNEQAQAKTIGGGRSRCRSPTRPHRVQAPPTQTKYQPRRSNGNSRRPLQQRRQRTRLIHARTSDPEHVSRPNQAPRRPTARRSSHQQGSARPRSKTRPPPTKIPPTPKPQTTPPDQSPDAARPRRTRPGCSRHSASSQVYRSSLTNPPPHPPPPPHNHPDTPNTNQCSHRAIRLFRFLKDSISPPPPHSHPTPPHFHSLRRSPSQTHSPCPPNSTPTSSSDNVHSRPRNVR